MIISHHVCTRFYTRISRWNFQKFCKENGEQDVSVCNVFLMQFKIFYSAHALFRFLNKNHFGNSHFYSGGAFMVFFLDRIFRNYWRKFGHCWQTLSSLGGRSALEIIFFWFENGLWSKFFFIVIINFWWSRNIFERFASALNILSTLWSRVGGKV